MRQGNNGRRPRGGRPNRRPGPLKAQTFDSNGPDVRIRGNAHQVYEKYLTLARDAGVSGDRVLGESYYQYAEHYYRIIHESTDPESPGSHRPHFRDPRYDDRDLQGRDWDGAGEEDGYPAQDGMVGGQGGGYQGGQQGGGGQQSGGGQQGGGQQGGYQGGQRNQRNERFDNQRRDGRNEGQRNEGQRNEGQRNESQRNEGQRNEGQRNEGQRYEGPRNEGPRNEGPRNEAPRPEQRVETPRAEAPVVEAPRAEAQVERRQPRHAAPVAAARVDEDDRSGLERALGNRALPLVAEPAAEPVEENAEAAPAPQEERALRGRGRLRRRQAPEETTEAAGPGRRPFPPRGEPADAGGGEGGDENS